MTNAYTYISDKLDKHHLATTFDYYTISYNLLKYSYLSTYNSNKKYSNLIKFAYIIDHRIDEYDTSYSHYCDYLKSWTSDMYNETNTPFYIKVLDKNKKIKITGINVNNSMVTPTFECKIDNERNFSHVTYTKEFNVCYIKNIKFTGYNKYTHEYSINLFNILNSKNSYYRRK